MSISRWLRTWKIGSAARRSSPSRDRCRPRLETLEDRLCPTYTVIDLGEFSFPSSLNESGQVVGESGAAALWENGVMTDLGTFGQDSSAAYDINDSGQVVGIAGGLAVYGCDEPPPPSQSFLWQNGVTAVIDGSGIAINNAGQSVGGGAVWEDGVMYSLNSLLPAGASLNLFNATDINDHGQIVGTGYTSDGHERGFLLTDDDGIFANGGAVVTDLGFDVAPRDYLPYRVNNSGQVIGVVSDSGNPYSNGSGFLYDHGVLSYIDVRGQGINDAGQIVGDGFLWQNGQRTDLNSLIDSSAGWNLANATDINERGDIIGWGYVAGQYHGFHLTESSVLTLTISDAVVTEGNTGTASASFTVTLSAASSEPVTVSYDTTYVLGGYHASAGSDYQGASGTLTFSPGETSKTITILVNGDPRDEFDENFGVELSNPTNAVFSRSEGLGTILDDDPPPALTINDVTVTESNTGTTSAVFTLTLSAPSDKPVSFYIDTGDGTAKASDNDYAPKSAYRWGFAYGETTTTVTVLVNGDTRGESDETFTVNLSYPTYAVIADSQGVGTILNDDLPSLAISDVTVTEGNTGTRSATFTVSLTPGASGTVTVNYASANGTALAGSDYQAVSGTLTFAPGETTKIITVLVIGDRLAEPNETFFVNLSNCVNATMADGQGMGTILDDEPRINIGDVTKSEGKKGRTTLFTFTVTLSAAYDQAVTMSFRTVDGTATTSDADYVAQTGTLTFNPGETTKTITIEVKGDSKNEANETFYLDLFGASSNSLFTRSRGVGTILNDD